MRRLTTTACLLAAAVTATALAQQQPLFRSGTRTVPVYATVTDRDGRLVPELTQADFEIYDNGKKQPITIFDDEIVPFSAVLALDTSASMTMNIEFVQDAAAQFVIRMLPQDAVAVGFFNSKVRISPGLSSDRDGLVRYIRNEMQYGNETRLWDAIDAALDHLNEATGRRVVVALTDGEDWGSSKGNGEVLDRAQREDVMVYAIGIESTFHNGQRWTTTRPGGSFRKMATETGGGYFELKKTADLNTTFSRVVQELHSQYLIGFAPTTLDGKEHKLEVRVTKPGLNVRARKTYVAK
ncbi:MAG: VWA domain-containing protein [Acidimicrobiia bacterium]|nr:VWA domain-containing protein [Acidimicrobiia bacterium]